MKNGSSVSTGVSGHTDGFQSPTPFRVLWIGNPTLALEFAATRASELHVTACECAALGRNLESALEGQAPRVDGVVVDATEDGIDALAVVDIVEAAAPELPVVLLVAERSGTAAFSETEPTVCDRVVKTQGFLHQVVPMLAQGRARLDLLAVFRATSEREARLRSILDLQPAVAVLVDGAGRMIAVNRAGLHLLGDEAGSTVVGKRFLDFVPADERAAAGRVFSDGGPLASAEHPLLRADGTRLHVRTRVTPFVHREGTVSLVTIDDWSTLQHVDESGPRTPRGVARPHDEEDDEGWEDVFGEAADEAPRAPAETAALAAETQRQAAMLRDAVTDLQSLAAECDRNDRALTSARFDRRIKEAALASSRREQERLSGALSDAAHQNDALSASLATRAEMISILEGQLAAATLEREALAADCDRLSRALQIAASASQTVSTSESGLSERDQRAELQPDAHATAAAAAPSVEEPQGQALLPPAPATEPDDGRDRRRHPRIDGAFNGERLGLMDTPVQIQNLSVGGCFVTSYYPPPSDPHFELRIDLDTHGVVVVDVQTAYVSPEVGYGVSFVMVTETARSRIEAAVEAGKPASRQGRHLARHTPTG